jgi:hypothetical protein
MEWITSVKIWTFSIFVIAKLNLRETVLNQENAKHNSRENKLVYSNGYHMDIVLLEEWSKSCKWGLNGMNYKWKYIAWFNGEIDTVASTNS